MTTRNIIETLEAVKHSVEVPELDRVAVQRLASREKRRRTRGRLAFGAAAAVVLVAGAVSVPHWVGSDGGGNDRFTDQLPSGRVANPTRLPMVLDGSLVLLEPDGTVTDTDVETEEVLGATDDGVVVIADQSRVLLFPYVGSESGVGAGQPLADANPVSRAWLSKDATTLTYLDLDGRLHVRPIVNRRDVYVSDPLDLEPVEANGDRWVTLVDGKTLRLNRSDVRAAVNLTRPQTAARDAEIAGDTVAVEQIEGVEFFDARRGESISEGGFGGDVGSLDATGTTYATGASQAYIEMGSSPWLTMIDVATSEFTDLTLPKGLDVVEQIYWGGSRFFVAVSGDGRSGILECDPQPAQCELRYDSDRDADLRLPTY